MSRKVLLVFALAVTLVLAAIVLADNTYSGGVSGTVVANGIIKSNGSRTVASSSATDDGTTFAIATNKFTVAESSGNTAIAGTLAVTGVMNGPSGATVSLTTPVVLTAAMSGQLFVSASTADAVQVFTLPPASTAGLVYCFSLGSSSLGSTREVDVEPQGASDLIIGTTNPAGATGIATTAGPAHGVKNTHATAVRGNQICLQSDGANTYYQRSLAGTWAAY